MLQWLILSSWFKHENEWAQTRRVRWAPSSQPKRDEYDIILIKNKYINPFSAWADYN